MRYHTMICNLYLTHRALVTLGKAWKFTKPQMEMYYNPNA